MNYIFAVSYVSTTDYNRNRKMILNVYAIFVIMHGNIVVTLEKYLVKIVKKATELITRESASATLAAVSCAAQTLMSEVAVLSVLTVLMVCDNIVGAV